MSSNMPDFPQTRDRQPELMDDPQISPKAHKHALSGLARLNRFSFIERTVWNAIVPFADDKPMRVLDIASGSGDLVIKLAQRAKRIQKPIEFTACDISEFAARVTTERAQSAGLEITTIQADITKDSIEGSYDIVMCHLFLHHLNEPQIVNLLVKMRSLANKGVIITDLLRTRRGYALAYLASRLLTRSHVVHVDALLSVRAALSGDELRSLAHEAGYEDAIFETIYPERMLLRCPC
jgi:2-polyprenyl-3-methyl-5-hydroxy-6-metoxy-1,4-benzoquinol methylase